MKDLATRILFLLLIFGALNCASAQIVIPETPTPTEITQLGVKQIVAILKDDKLQAPEQKPLKQALVRKAFNSVFNFDEMAKSSLGSWYRRLKNEPSYQALESQYIKAFVDYLAANYMDRLEASKEDIRISFVKEWREGEFATVYAIAREVKINGAVQNLNVIYSLRWYGDLGWRVFDLKIENMSTINYFRDKFGRFLEHDTFENLIKAIRENKA